MLWPGLPAQAAYDPAAGLSIFWGHTFQPGQSQAWLPGAVPAQGGAYQGIHQDGEVDFFGHGPSTMISSL